MSLTDVNGTLFFTANDGVNGNELWKSDGTEAGTVLVKDIKPGLFGSGPINLRNVNGMLFFAADDGVNGRELWKSDASESGTVLVKDILPGSGSSMGSFEEMNGTMFFQADDGVHGPELWKSDGMESGTVLVKDITPGSVGRVSRIVGAMNGSMFFTVDNGGSPLSGDLWKTDGTENGTVMVKEFDQDSNLRHFTSAGGALYFTESDEVAFGPDLNALWKSDGTTAGTVIVKNGMGEGELFGSLMDVNGVLFFNFDDSVHGRELWKTDGTALGTVLVKDLNPGSNRSNPELLTTVNGVLFFSAAVPGNTNNRQLWRSDGTDSGTYLVHDADPSRDPYSPATIDSTLYYLLNSGTNLPSELWKLEVDPAESVLGDVAWVRQFGGASWGDVQVWSAELDSENNLIMAGPTASALPGQVSAGGDDAYVRKYDRLGNVVWTRQFGTSGSDYASGVAVDPSTGSIYVVGAVEGTLPGQVSSGSDDVFLRKYDSNGNELWTRQYGSTGSDWSDGIALAASGDIVVSSNVVVDGEYDGMVRNYQPDGTLDWSTTVGTLGYEEVIGIDTDAAGNIYLSGLTDGTFAGQSSAGAEDGFLAKLDTDGNQTWVRQFGTDQYDNAWNLAVDAAGEIYVSGETFGVFSGQTDLGADADGFIRKYDADGNALWTRQFGSRTSGFAYEIATDATGIYVAGTIDGDALVRKYSADGDELGTNRIGTADTDRGWGVAVAPSGAVYLVGDTQGALPGQSLTGTRDAFVVKIRQPPIPENLAESIEDLPETATEVQAVAAPETLETWVAAVENLPPRTTGPAVDIVLNLVSGDYNLEEEVNVPEGYQLIINGESGTVTFQGNSPALIVASGTVVVYNGAKFVNGTDAPTILVTGGHLIVRDSRIVETTGGEQAAIEILGGTVDLGTANDPGGNTIVIHGSGDFIRNTGVNPVSALGNTFQIDTGSAITTLTTPFRIGEEIFDALDAGGGGLVTYIDGNIYVSTSSGTVFDDLDSDGEFEPGNGEAGIEGVTVTLTGGDADGPVNRTTVTGADGSYAFTNVSPGTYTVTADQAVGLLDGKETAGSLGGTVDNSQDSNTIADIVVVNGDPDATGYNFAEIQPSEALGLVWQDFNNDGDVNFGEQAIEEVTINLDGTDDRGNPVSRSVQTDANGIYMFIDLRPGDYTISEVQPAGLNDGLDVVGTVNGVPVGDNSVNDTISGVALALPGSIAENYNFGERPVAGGEVDAGQTATIGFWQNNNGQALILELNGGATSTQLGDWLATNFLNMYGANARAHDLTGFTNSQVADFYSDLFRRKKKEAEQLGLGGPPKTDAQVFATALAVYVTNSTLAGTTAESYGFVVTENGVGVSTFNVGDNGDAFDVADNSDVSVLALLLATNDKAVNGVLYDLDGDGDADDSLETLLRKMANDVYSGINEQGDI